MANSLNTNPAVIDTSFSSYKASIVSTLGSLIGAVICVKIRWVAPSAANQTLEITDPQGGTQLAMLTSVAAGQDVEEDFSASPRLFRDFGVIIPSGKVFLFVK